MQVLRLCVATAAGLATACSCAGFFARGASMLGRQTAQCLNRLGGGAAVARPMLMNESVTAVKHGGTLPLGMSAGTRRFTTLVPPGGIFGRQEHAAGAVHGSIVRGVHDGKGGNSGMFGPSDNDTQRGILAEFPPANVGVYEPRDNRHGDTSSATRWTSDAVRGTIAYFGGLKWLEGTPLYAKLKEWVQSLNAGNPLPQYAYCDGRQDPHAVWKGQMARRLARSEGVAIVTESELDSLATLGRRVYEMLRHFVEYMNKCDTRPTDANLLALIGGRCVLDGVFPSYAAFGTGRPARVVVEVDPFDEEGDLDPFGIAPIAATVEVGLFREGRHLEASTTWLSPNASEPMYELVAFCNNMMANMIQSIRAGVDVRELSTQMESFAYDNGFVLTVGPTFFDVPQMHWTFPARELLANCGETIIKEHIRFDDTPESIVKSQYNGPTYLRKGSIVVLRPCVRYDTDFDAEGYQAPYAYATKTVYVGETGCEILAG